LLLIAALGAIACGDGSDEARATSDIIEVQSSTTARSETVSDASAGPGIDLSTLLARADQPGDVRAMLEKLLPPSRISKQPIPNTHWPAQIDTIRTLHYPGLEIIVYHVSASRRDIVRTIRVSDDDWATRDGLSVGLSRAQVRTIKGEPDRLENDKWIYEVGDVLTWTTLHVDFEGDHVASLAWHYYID
jgi:hypothetical protein